MTDSEKVAEWCRWFTASTLKMNALLAVRDNDPQLLGKVLEKLGLKTAVQVVEACKDDAVTFARRN